MTERNAPTLHQDMWSPRGDHILHGNVPQLPPEIWIEIIDYLELEDIWIRIRRCCLLFHAISTEIAHRHVALRINNLCSVHTGNALSLSTPHFHWQGQDNNVSTHVNYVTWSELPEDQHPDIFLVPAEEIPTCFSLYLAGEMSWTYTLRIIFRRAEVSDDGVEKWVADSEGGWEMQYGTIKGPVQQGVSPERALKWRRVCPTKLVVPLAGLVYAEIPWVARENERGPAWLDYLRDLDG